MANKFLQFDPTKNNMQSDAAYSASSYRANGATSGLAPSAVHNKLFYQLSTFVAALGEALSNKGYDMDDSDITALITEMSNIMTLADMSVYALTEDLSDYVAKAAVVVKTADYVITANDFYKTIEANKATSISFTLPLYSDIANGDWIFIKNVGAGVLTLNGIIDGQTNPTLNRYDEITIYSDGTALRGKILSGATTYDFSASLTENGYQKLPSGLILQWGKYTGTLSETEYEVTFATPFLTTCLNFSGNVINISGSWHHNTWVQVKTLTATKAKVIIQAAETIGGDGFYWQAIGY